MISLVTKEIIDEMYQRYPIGTKIKCLKTWTDQIDETGVIEFYNNPGKDIYEQIESDRLSVHGSRFWLTVWYDNKWAEIIEYPKGYEYLSELDSIREWLNNNDDEKNIHTL